MAATVEPIIGRYMSLSLGGREHRLYFEQAGQGIPLVCLHTAGADGRQYRHLMNDAAVTQHFRVLAFDMPWHGKSLPPVGFEREDYVLTCFPRLKQRLKQSGGTLSGGEQQMLAIGRCLMMRPKLIILDEPTEGIMPRLVSQIRREIHRINQSGVSILLVEQNVETALKLCPRVFLMEKGTVVYSGTSHELKSRPEIVNRYLGLSH